MPQRRRPSAAGLMLLLLLAVLGPASAGPTLFGPALSGSPLSGSALSRPSGPAPAAATARPLTAARPEAPSPTGAAVVSVRSDQDTGGGSCRPLDVPQKGTEVVVPHAPTDPLTASATARTPLPQAPAPRARVPRAPPASLVGSAELLPVLRI
ncbi:MULTISPECIES: hypothetical protein [Streptomyces]|uniref:hypothetical protein n=1 Tax=Streptomyces TaxID=1883 RepID=UPI00163C7437|nr:MULTISPECIES: hypothetical protein [Streptomyces]MBC2877795.1 hypothetical protein [Streptomyces sp. TYQ1024]UBI38696.1 hypothetical protein K7I03_21020 [Streptomyces mobaraensis]UKW31277.1 hypothetical protein MCU78_20970 [Streptomyces sp. TYQ1024]